MRTELVEIYADTTNAAIMRHPGRNFPGSLIQGDSLYNLYRQVDELCKVIGCGGKGYEAANELRNDIGHRLDHYKAVVTEHGIRLPFFEQP